MAYNPLKFDITNPNYKVIIFNVLFKFQIFNIATDKDVKWK